jgi:hypothetical protein
VRSLIVSDATDNPTTLQTLIDSQYDLLLTEQILYTNLVEDRTALVYPDISTANNSGPGGDESYGAPSLTEQISACAARIKELTDQLRDLMRLKNERFPFTVMRRARVRGGIVL